MSEAVAPRVARIPYRTWWSAPHLHLGQHPSRWRGAGLAFDQLQECQHGAEMRTINWAATARRGGTPLLVNTYHEDKAITLMLLVDLSASMEFGSLRLSKKALAAELSASLVYSARLEHDHIGLLGFTAGVDVYLPPRQSPAYQRLIPAAILESRPGHSPANFAAAVAAFEARVKSPALVFVLSDFMTDDTAQLCTALARLQRRAEVIALVIADPREASLPVGQVRMALRDWETGTTTVYTFSSQNCQRMQAMAEARRQQLQELLHGVGIAQVVVTPCSDYVEDLTQLCTHRRDRRPPR